MVVHFGEYIFDSASHRLTRSGEVIPLTPKAFTLLEVLVVAHPAAVSKNGLYDALWPATFVEMGNLYSLVAEIRTAAGDHSIIRTVQRFGYALGFEPEAGLEAVAHLFIGERSIALHQGENIIGRDMIHAPDVSRCHARIVVSTDEATVEDLGSTNGTWVDGRRIDRPTKLTNGVTITLALTEAVFAFVRDAVTLPVQGPHA